MLVRLACALALTLVCAPAHARDWQAATEYPATTMPGEGLVTLARLVEEASHGELHILPKFDAPGGLRSGTIIGAVETGRLEVGDAFAGAIGKLDPIFLTPSLPFLAVDEDQARKLYDIARPAYERAFARHDQRLLYATPWPPSGIWSAEPVASLDAFRKLSIRAYDATGVAVLRAAGANAVELSFADTMPKLRDHTLNAVLSSGDGGAGRKLWEFTPHFTEIGYAVPLSFTTVSSAAFDALDEATRALVLKAAAETEAAQWERLRTRIAANYETMRKNGVAIAPAPPELANALAAAARDRITEWEKAVGPDGSAILQAYRGP